MKKRIYHHRCSFIVLCLLTALLLYFFYQSYHDHIVEEKIQTYCETYFPDQKLISFSDSSVEHFSQFILHSAFYHGNRSNERFTVQELQAKIDALGGNGAFSMRVDFDYAPAEYYKESGSFIPHAHEALPLQPMFIYAVQKNGSGHYSVSYVYGIESPDSWVESIQRKWDIFWHPEKYDRYSAGFSMVDNVVYYTGSCRAL